MNYFCEANFKPHEVRKNSTFIMLKRTLGKMRRGFLSFCKPNLLLFEDQLGFEIKICDGGVVEVV